jgi:hypothetical protein
MDTKSRRENNPYVGPRALQKEEKIYGRDNERLELLDLLIAERIVLLYSPSGAGKSSLIEAGLRQELIAEGFDVLPTARVNTPLPSEFELPPDCNRYVFSVLHSLQDDKAAPGKDVPDPRELPRMNLKAYLDRWAGTDSNIKKKILILDQFEEILTINPTDIDGKKEFFAQLGAALHDRHWWALFSMREEFLGALDPYLPYIPTRLIVRFRLDLLKEDAAREAIQNTARAANAEFTDEAAIKLVNDLRRVRIQGFTGGPQERTGPYVEPVQLQVVCFRLWKNLPENKNKIDVREVEKHGAVDSALGDYYAERVADIAKEPKVKVSERMIREWFGSRLITAQGIRGQVLKGVDQSDGLDNEAINGLVRVHLVRAEERLNATWYELAHDRLIEPVLKNNREWEEVNLNILQIRAPQWEKQKRSKDLLLNYKELIEAERWAFKHGQEMIGVEQTYLEACRNSLSELQQQAIQWETQSRPSTLLLQKNSLLDAERWAITRQGEITDLELNFLNECRASLSPLQRQVITWEIHGRKSDHMLQGREMVEAKRWADEHDDQLSYIDREFLSACQDNLSQLQQQALLWESQSRSNRLLLDGAELLNANIWTLENSGELTQSERDFLEACQEAEDRREQERKQIERERAQARRIRKLAIWFGIAAAIGILATATTIFFYKRADSRYQELITAKFNEARLEEEKRKDAEKDKQEAELKFKADYLNDLKFSEQVIEQAFAANNELKRLDQPENDERRSKITIKYYPRDVNRERLSAVLRDLGYQLTVKPSKDLETNAIWYGSEVCKNIEDVQLVAYTLMSAGVEIKIVAPLEGSKGRENSILVGGNSIKRIVNAPSKTVEDIRNLKNCVRQ